MTRIATSSILALSLAVTAPHAAMADVKDVIIGGIIGAAINQGINDSKKKKTSVKRAAPKKKSTVKRSAPSLNSSYSVLERKQIQTSLNAMGLNVGVVDGVLGRNSRSAIAQFQASRGEAATGQLTRAQYVALTGAGFATAGGLVPDRRLTGNEVVMLQQGLQAMGFYRGAIDGIDGRGTQGARTAFLVSQNRDPIRTTQVQSLVLAAAVLGYQVPAYLQQEAQAQFAAANPQQGFGAAPQQPVTAGFGAPATVPPQGQVNAFAAPAAPAQQGFGAPAQQGFGTPVAAQPGFGAQPQSGTFGAPQQQAGFGGQQPVQQPGAFGAAPQAGFAAQPQVAATPQPLPLFGAPPAQGTTGTFQAAPQQQAVPQPQGVFAATAPGTQPLVQGQVPVAQPQQGGLDVFALPAGTPAATVAPQANEAAFVTPGAAPAGQLQPAQTGTFGN